MKTYLIFAIGMFYSCSTNDTKTQELISSSASEVKSQIISDTLNVHTDSLEMMVQGGKRLYQGKLFAGYSTKTYPNGQLAEKTFYVNGKREGTAMYWFDTGTVWKTKEFVDNKLNGLLTVFFSDGQKASTKNYRNNKLDGLQEIWYEDGKIFKRLNYANGKEVGLQQGWTTAGKFFANYEVINGRIFGLKRMDLCFGLTDEKIEFDK